ncbi:MAG TPA: amidase family protein [Pseudonocardia sp.]|nr:amidase family protein [Pseudonocardia sp.]
MASSWARLRRADPRRGEINTSAGRLPSSTLTDRTLHATVDRIDHNAMTSVEVESGQRGAWEADRGRAGDSPLTGLPMVVSDTIHVAGLPNTAGTPALADFVPARDAPSVHLLREAGALLLGKANVHELSIGVTGADSALGPLRNAVDPTRLAGGGSGGVAAAVALGAPAGLAVDTCGSARIPAALNGVCALRPTFGRYLCGGLTPLSASRGTVAPISQTIDDLALIDSVLAGEPAMLVERESMPRLGVPTSYRDGPCDRVTVETFEAVLDRLGSRGVTIVEVPNFPLEGAERDVGMPIIGYEFRRDLARYLGTYHPSCTIEKLVAQLVSPDIAHFFRRYVLDKPLTEVTDAAYEEAFTFGRSALRARYRRAFLTYDLDALVLPTTPRRAMSVAGSGDELGPLPPGVPTPNAYAADVYTRHTAPGSLVGLPGLTLPVRTDDGLPMGLGLDGSPRGDRHLLSIGKQLESLLSEEAAPSLI